MKKPRKRPIGSTQVYKTYSLLEKHETEPETGVPLPSLEAIELAKRTVDENEL